MARAVAPGRAQFVLTVMVLLGMGLVATLWLSTAAAADSYRLQDARAAARDLSERSERLHRDVAALQSPPALAQRATELGMVPAKDPARLVVAADGTTTVVGEPAAAVAPPAAAIPPGLGGGMTPPAPEAPSTTSVVAAPQAVLAAAVAAVKPVAKEAEAAEAATEAAEGDGPDATGDTSSDADSRSTSSTSSDSDGTARTGGDDSATGTSRAAAHSGEDRRRHRDRFRDRQHDAHLAGRRGHRHRHRLRGHDRRRRRVHPHRHRERHHDRHHGAHHPDDNGHRLMPAAPPRTRPAGAARSSPSAPRPGGRGGRPTTRTPDPRHRLRVGQIVLVVALVVATVKLVVVQGPQAGTLQAGSARQRTSEIALPAERGRILDRAGAPLAFSVEARALVTNPRLIATTKGAGTAAYVTEMAATIAQATGADATALRTALESDKGYVVLVPLVDPDVARTLRDKYPEIAEEKRESRQYPGGALAANVVGVASWNATDRKLTGLMGLESSQDNLLAGQDGLRVVDTAEGSSAVIPGSTRFERPATPGSDLQLTLDSDLQYTMQRQLAEYAAAKGARGGSAVVLDAKTGEVLAMANARTFDPRAFSAADEATLGNPAVSSPYEPGSVNKVVTMAAALEYRTAARTACSPSPAASGSPTARSATPGTTAPSPTR